MVLFGQSNHHRSGELTVVVGVSLEEDGWVDLLDVQGSREAPGANALSDVDWFREDWSAVGADMLWDKEDCPAAGKWLVKGYLEAWCSDTLDGVEWDSGFVVELLKPVSKKTLKNNGVG